MRLIVFSDTHRDLRPVRRALRQAGPADRLLHAGDHYADAVVLRESVVINGMHFFNPGSLSRPRAARSGSYGVIEVDQSGFTTHIRFLDGE